MRPNFDVSDKTILITGGSRGLGKAMALSLAEAGAKIVVSSRKLDACEIVASQIQTIGGTAMPFAAHSGKTKDLDALLDATYERFGRLDVLINNAASNPAAGPLTSLEESLFDKMFSVNVKGPWYLASRAALRMREHGGGSIINIISMGAFKPGPNIGFYVAGKAALHAFTKVMAQEWAGWNIRVNSLAPGTFQTDMMAGTLQVPELRDMMTNACVMKRIAEPEELTGAVLYLASDASSYVTGSVMTVDGGMLP